MDRVILKFSSKRILQPLFLSLIYSQESNIDFTQCPFWNEKMIGEHYLSLLDFCNLMHYARYYF